MVDKNIEYRQTKIYSVKEAAANKREMTEWNKSNFRVWIIGKVSS